MNKYVITAALIIGITTSALADSFYVMFDKTAKKCSVSKTAPTDTEKFSMMGTYGSEAEAMTAMGKMAECKG